MIPADQWRAYNEAVDSIRSAAESEVRDAVLDWLNGHPGASVAEAREEAARIMRGAVQRHDKEAAALAARWYDAQGRAAGAALDRAVTAPAYSGDAVQTLARYQVRRYQAGDLAGFAAMCGEFAANDAMRSVNETVLRNARRDKAKGVRFARVTSGHNTCAFCLMLAGRGAVYWSRESAGAFNEWHRHCTCKVVPSYSGDRWETLVEGHDPRDAKRWSDRIEAAKGSRREIPGFPDDVTAECEQLGGKLSDAWSAYAASGKTSDSYRRNYASLVESLVPENPIHIEDFVKLEGKELQEAAWAARTGHSITFRNPEQHNSLDSNTSDVLIDGITCDFKRSESNNVSKLVKRITEKLERQGPRFLADISDCSLKREDVEVRLSRLLDDERIEAIYLVSNGQIEVLKK